MRVGVVGAGNMGRGIAASLRRSNFAVFQFDRSAENLRRSAREAPGVQPVGALSELAQQPGLDTIVVSVAGEEAERSVFCGDEGLLRLARPESLLIGCGTVSVELAEDIHRLAAAGGRGIDYLDAPVSGGPDGAASGQLSIMCGGTSAAFARAQPVLGAMGKAATLVGGGGAGAAAKLVNQLVVSANALAAAEAFALAEAMDLDLDALDAVLSAGWAQSTMLSRTAAMVRRREDALSAASAAPLVNFRKDLALIAAAAASKGVDTPSVAAAANAVDGAYAAGAEQCDWAAVRHLLRRRPRPPPSRSLWTTARALERDLPERSAEGDVHLLRARTAALLRGRAPLCVVDDDPTGTQTVHSVPVLAEWGADALGEALRGDAPAFYLLSNTRALPPEDAARRAFEIGRNLRDAAAAAGVDAGGLSVVSRGDSTLRGHYPLETDALCAGLGRRCATVIAPFFLDGGRITAADEHFVAADGLLTRCSDTEFASDRAFGYATSHLPSWVEEKTGGAVPAADVLRVSLEDVRAGGAERVAEALLEASLLSGVAVLNAVDAADAQTLALGCRLAEARGAALLYRCAGSLVSALMAQAPRPLLTAEELRRGAPGTGGGLVVVGSYVGKTSAQLRVLRERCPWLAPVELRVPAVAAGGEEAAAEARRAAEAVDAALRGGSSAVLYTSRERVQEDGCGGLAVGAAVNEALCGVVAGLARRPSFLVAKGGITSNDVAVKGLGVRRAAVRGQALPGVPVWTLGAESAAPGMNYVVFPGNVGADGALADAAELVAPAAGAGATVPDLLREARAAGRAVAAFNVYNLEGALAVLRAVERTALPAILQLHPAPMELGGGPLLAACLAAAAGARAAPVRVQLDHAEDEAMIRSALDGGAHGVMADGSAMGYADNAAWTRRMAALAHSRGASAEAELGRLAGEEDGLSVAERDARMTDPAVVGDFLAQTEVDALAVTIGNVHGKYAVQPPRLDWDRLDAVRDAAGGVPLVLHGASGLPPEMLAEAIRRGVTKFNVNTELRGAARRAVKDASDAEKEVIDVMRDAIDAMALVAEAKLRAMALRD